MPCVSIVIAIEYWSPIYPPAGGLWAALSTLRLCSGRRFQLAAFNLPLATCHLSLATCHLPLVTCHLPLVTCHLSLATCHLPLATCHLFKFTNSNFSPSNSPLSLSFSFGITNNAIKDNVMNGARRLHPMLLTFLSIAL